MLSPIDTWGEKNRLDAAQNNKDKTSSLINRLRLPPFVNSFSRTHYYMKKNKNFSPKRVKKISVDDIHNKKIKFFPHGNSQVLVDDIRCIKGKRNTSRQKKGQKP